MSLELTPDLINVMLENISTVYNREVSLNWVPCESQDLFDLTEDVEVAKGIFSKDFLLYQGTLLDCAETISELIRQEERKRKELLNFASHFRSK
jgi:hypothetical protein